MKTHKNIKRRTKTSTCDIVKLNLFKKYKFYKKNSKTNSIALLCCLIARSVYLCFVCVFANNSKNKNKNTTTKKKKKYQNISNKHIKKLPFFCISWINDLKSNQNQNQKFKAKEKKENKRE